MTQTGMLGLPNSAPFDTSDIRALREEVESCINSVRHFDDRIEERNRHRLELIEHLRDFLPEEDFKRFEHIITKTIDSFSFAPEHEVIQPITIDDENPVESIRRIRNEIAKEVCNVMGVSAPNI